MPAVSPDDLIAQLEWRYAVKTFDPTRRIPDDLWGALERSLVLTPSSFGLQPWKFMVIIDPAIKARLQPVTWNQTQTRDCSHFVVFLARKSLNEHYVGEFIQSVADTRQMPVTQLDGYRSVIEDSVKQSAGQHLDWNAKQVYIALGQLMTVAAMLGVDTCPMEGFVHDDLQRVLNLENTEYVAIVCCALGYRSADDKYARVPKVRFPAERVVHKL
ncbi:MAG TPA: NAD(P)H-dependent oxidoreductase [Tepidisphaeraceae bacterium]|nr:NAD(P)H-dependent oxidoreductase [Tepidisphaeraceae bacterium]